MNEYKRPTPEQFLSMRDKGDKPKIAVLCDHGEWKSVDVAEQFRTVGFDAISLTGGISELFDPRYGMSEAIREQTIEALAHTPTVIIILEDWEYNQRYGKHMDVLKILMVQNSTRLIHAQNRNIALGYVRANISY